MKKVFSLLMILTVSLGTYGEPTLEWSKDLSNLVDLSGHDLSGGSMPVYCQEFIDGSVGLIIPASNHSDPSLLVVLSDDGDKIFSTTNTGGSAMFPAFSSTTNKFAIYINYTTFRLFERSGNSFPYVDIDAINVGWSGDGVDSPKYLFSIADTVLSKYVLASSPVLVPSFSGIENLNYKLGWESEPGVQYQIQTTTNLINWSPIGLQITGTGSTLYWSTVLASSNEFYRVILP